MPAGARKVLGQECCLPGADRGVGLGLGPLPSPLESLGRRCPVPRWPHRDARIFPASGRLAGLSGVPTRKLRPHPGHRGPRRWAPPRCPAGASGAGPLDHSRRPSNPRSADALALAGLVRTSWSFGLGPRHDVRSGPAGGCVAGPSRFPSALRGLVRCGPSCNAARFAGAPGVAGDSTPRKNCRGSIGAVAGPGAGGPKNRASVRSARGCPRCFLGRCLREPSRGRRYRPVAPLLRPRRRGSCRGFTSLVSDRCVVLGPVPLPSPLESLGPPLPHPELVSCVRRRCLANGRIAVSAAAPLVDFSPASALSLSRSPQLVPSGPSFAMRLVSWGSAVVAERGVGLGAVPLPSPLESFGQRCLIRSLVSCFRRRCPAHGRIAVFASAPLVDASLNLSPILGAALLVAGQPPVPDRGVGLDLCSSAVAPL